MYGFVSSICLRYANGKEEAQELVQDVFVKVFTKIDMYDGALSFYGWIKTIAIRTCIDRYRSNQTLVKTVDIEDANCTDSTTAEVFLAMDAQHLLDLVSKLPPSYRTAFNLFAVEGYEYHEIATLLDVHIGSVKSNISKARAKLKAWIIAENTTTVTHAR